jgi:hypothetical protein
LSHRSRRPVVALALLGISSPADDRTAGVAPARKRLLVITESRGFVHDVVRRKGGELCLVEKALIEMALGHPPEVWKDERFLKHLLGGLRYVLGLESGDATPSAKE